MTDKEFAWVPPVNRRTYTYTELFKSAYSVDTFFELRERAIREPDWFWDSVVQLLGIPFDQPYEKVLDTSDGIEWAKWFVGGKLNYANVCVDRWVAHEPAMPAVIWEG